MYDNPGQPVRPGRLDRSRRADGERVPELIVAEEHSQIYDLWRERGSRGLRIAHVDFHCDMRGLLIDRRRGVAWRIDAGDRRNAVVDSGNFLAHAIAEGIVTSVRWVHDDHGGRRYDVGTVKYESDLTALPHRLLHRLRGEREVPLRFEEISLARWDGMGEDEQLDVDWDGLASIDYSDERIRRLTEAFLARDFAPAPALAYLVHSPGYSSSDRGLFERFAEHLAGKLGASIRRLPAPAASSAGQPRQRTLTQRLGKSAVLGLHRAGIY